MIFKSAFFCIIRNHFIMRWQLIHLFFCPVLFKLPTLTPLRDAGWSRDEVLSQDETAFLRDKVPRKLRVPDVNRRAPYDAASRPTFLISRFPLLANVSPWHVGSETRSSPATINQFKAIYSDVFGMSFDTMTNARYGYSCSRIFWQDLVIVWDI